MFLMKETHIGGRASRYAAVTACTLILLATALPSGAQKTSLTSIPSYPTASKDDWEEINFEYDHAVLTDGFPSLLRLGELLNRHPEYKVRLEGHGDQMGPDAYNMHLGQKRADAVKTFLLKYGAKESQVDAISKGKRDPKIAEISPAARFMNRRVALFVMDKDGKMISAGSVGDAIKAIDDSIKKLTAMSEQCCSDILKRLDSIADQLKKLGNESDGLRKELDRLNNGQQKLGQDLTKLADAKPATSSTTGSGLTSVPGGTGANGNSNATTGLNGGGGPGGNRNLQEGANTGNNTGNNSGSDNNRNKRDSGLSAMGGGSGTRKFQLLGANVGADDLGKVTFTGRARYFAPFAEKFAVQAQGEYMYFRDRQEGQFDLGLVTRWHKRFQTGMFSSFRTVNMRAYNNNGTLGQASLTADYLFGRGRVGLFGTKAFLDESVVDRRKISPSYTLETYLKAVDQVGVSGAIQLWKRNFAEGNFGYLHGRGVASRPGGTVRLVFPVSDMIALSLEGGMNETLLGRSNMGRVVGGVLIGDYTQPKEFLGADGPVPVDVPRVRYEVLTRRVRTGFAAPVADAGPDQIGIAAGTVSLDGSGSYHPDGDPLTYEWTQVAGPTVAITGVRSVRASFQAEEGMNYAFRLTVRDPQGAIAVARTVVTTRSEPGVRVVQFVANPAIIRLGQSASLAWQVENADEVSISGIGPVDAKAGTVSVSPTDTTTYRLTAKNRKGELNATVTVTVERTMARVLNFSASPMTITAGQSSTLSWSTENAEQVEISGIGAVAVQGSQSVTPAETTTYTMTVRNRGGTTSATVTIQVQPQAMPRVMRFLAAPREIFVGETSTLIWSVENATDVSISSVGVVEASGTNAVAPLVTTVYTLTARNAAGEASATATVTVYGPPRITLFTGRPLTIKAGETSTLEWKTEDATTVTLSGAGTVQPNGTLAVKPAATTTYTLTAIGRRGNTVSQQVTVTVEGTTPGGGGPGPGTGGGRPVADAGADRTVLDQMIRLDGSKSYHPDGKLIRFSWRSVGSLEPKEIRGADTAQPTVYFQHYGQHVFELTVTDADGKFATLTVRIFWAAYGSPAP